MKKTLSTTILAILMCVCMVFGLASCANQEDIDNSVNTAIAPISEQITSINTSIDDLKAVDTTLDGYIDALEAKATELEASDTATADEITAIKSVIETLKTKDTALESKITTLENYVNTELSATEDWAEATFATLAQYAEIQTDITGIKTTLTTLVDNTALSTAISTSEDGMKEWVNKALADGYYTISQIDTKLSDLETKLNNADGTLAVAIEEQKTALETAKTDLTTAYNNAIAEAISDNNGVINQKIADDIAAAKTELQGKIDTINGEITQIKEEITALNSKISALKEALAALEQENAELKEQMTIVLNCLNGIHVWNAGDCEHCEETYYEITGASATINYPTDVTQEEMIAATQNVLSKSVTSITVARELTTEEVATFESGINKNAYISVNGQEYHGVVDATGLTNTIGSFTDTSSENIPTVKLMANINSSSQITTSGNYSLDLNGKSLNFSSNVGIEIVGGNVKIVDTGTSGSMNATRYPIYVTNENAIVTLKSGSYSGGWYGVLLYSGNLIIEGGTYRNTDKDKPAVTSDMITSAKLSVKNNPTIEELAFFRGVLDLSEATGSSYTVWKRKDSTATSFENIILPNGWKLYDANGNEVTSFSIGSDTKYEYEYLTAKPAQ